jgi:hypothetical protein
MPDPAGAIKVATINVTGDAEDGGGADHIRTFGEYITNCVSRDGAAGGIGGSCPGGIVISCFAVRVTGRM